MLYEGLGGWVVAGGRGAAEIEAAGGRALDLRAGETGWIFLVEDGATAEFEPGVRVLVRSGHEVLLATAGTVPRLTATSAAVQRGLEMPIRLGARALRAPRESRASPLGPAQVDPLIQQLVAEMDTTDYLATWQALEGWNRHTFSVENFAATQWILDQLRSFGLRAEFHEYNQNGPRRNVIATLPGVVDSTQVVYLCAHLDAVPEACGSGADDDGSGTAAVIEAARLLSRHRFHHTIKFALFNAEEQGLVGSQAYAEDIALAGENVIGAFALDMVAYGGVDAAPPDLVLYVNTASTALATLFSDAIDLYLPGVLQPVVLVQTLNASDHASFWGQGYPGLLAIEDAAWGSDFCPWYHTCNDVIARYVDHAYPVDCARAAMAAAAMLAVPVPESDAFLAVASSVVDDDGDGGSSGNADGQANPGEILELEIELENLGGVAATGVSAVLRSASPLVTVIDSVSGWSDVPPASRQLALAPFRVGVGTAAPHGAAVELALVATDAAGTRTLPFALPIVAAAVAPRLLLPADPPPGNGNGRIDPGEVLMLPVTLVNLGGQESFGVVAQLTSLSPHLTVLSSEAAVATLPPGAAEPATPAFQVAIDPAAAMDEILEVTVGVSTHGGIPALTSFRLRVGGAFLDDMESDRGWSVAAPDDDAAAGRWIRVDPNPTWNGGPLAQPDNDHTGAPGTRCFVTGQAAPQVACGFSDIDGGKTTLTSPSFDLTRLVHPRVSYWRWYANFYTGTPNPNLWTVQVSADGGESWVDLENTATSEGLWKQMTFVLESYVTPSAATVFRFVARDGTVNGSIVEAALDDFEISGDLGPVEVAELPIRALAFDPPHPNPARGAATLGFALPTAAEVVAAVYDVDGRLVRTLARGVHAAGRHRLAWDGSSDRGHPAAPAVYFCRLEANGTALTRRFSLLR